MRRYFTIQSILLLVSICITNGFSQTTSLPSVIPPTPNAASLGKYGNTPIGAYTGQPNVSLPLYEIKYNDLTVPISLSYNYSGLKVEEYPGWVGAGWTIMGTGVISRQTRSLPDESSFGYNGQNQTGLKVLDFINNGEVVNTTNSPFLDRVRNGASDSEPDIFVFSLPGGPSGKFFFDESQCGSQIKQATIIPHQKLSITGYFNYAAKYNIKFGVIEKFVITDQKGIRYTFDIAEKAAGVEQGDPEENDFANSWYLSSIVTPNGNNIVYSYRYRVIDMPATLYEKRVIALSTLTGFNLPNDVINQFTSASINEAILDRITFRGGHIDFFEGETRLDWNSDTWVYSKRKATVQPKTLGKISVSVGSKLVKDINFSYSYFGAETRLRLDSIQEVNGSEVSSPYRFYYKDGSFPDIGNEYSLYQQDHWGYYRGGNANTMLPPFNQTFLTQDGNYMFINVPGNSREPNSITASYGILTKLIYPTGGYTEFEYEGNNYWGKPDTDFNLCSGDFEQAADAGAALDWGDGYGYDTLTVTEKTCVKLQYTMVTPCVDGEATIRVITALGTDIAQHVQQQKITGTTYSNFGPGNGETFVLTPGTYYLSVIVINENACGSLTSAKATLHKIVQNDQGFANLTAGGVRVKNVSDCNSSQACVTKHYSYQDINNPTQSSGRLINEPVYQYYQSIIVDNGEDPPQLAEIPCSILFAHSEVPIASTSGGVIGYRYVMVMEKLDSTKGMTVQQFTSAQEYPDEGELEYPFPPRISNDWKRGLMILKEDYGMIEDDTVQVLTSQNSQYNLQSSYNRKVAIKPKKQRDSKSGIYVMTLNDFDFESYSLASGWSNVFQQDENIFNYKEGTQRVVGTRKNFFYENETHLLPTRIVTTNSKGDSLKTTMKYVQDVNNVEGLTPAERASIQSNPNKTAMIERKDFSNEELQSTERILYDGPRLTQVLGSTGLNPIEEYFKVNTYDSYGNILNYTKRSGENTSYLYDVTRQYPIAEVKNANAENIFYEGFEGGGTIDPLAKSGKKSHSGDYTLTPPQDLVVLPSSVLSYWYWSNGNWVYKELLYSGGSLTLSDGDKIDELRIRPQHSVMTTYNYDLGIGVNSITDSNNITTYFNYDGLGRLKSIKDDKGNILKHYKYHYSTEQPD